MNNFAEWLKQPVKAVDKTHEQKALARQQQLTKPPGSLGQLENLAVKIASLQASEIPDLTHVHITVYAADHGVMAEGVSAFPQSVTAAMIRNFANGGAAISVLAQELMAKLDVINVGTVEALEEIPGVLDKRIDAGTANFCQSSAMTEQQCQQALLIGRDNVFSDIENTQLYIAGEMGIGNTTAATALASVLLTCDPADLVGPGTGLDQQGVQHKLNVIRRALEQHSAQRDKDALTVLQTLGGFEIAAMVGAYLTCSKQGIPVLIDGFISTVAALIAEKIQAGCKDWFIYSHQSAEPGHQVVLEALNAEPLLKLDMRLGEGSGAAVAVPLLRQACLLHNGMATFEQANISKGDK
ncbi:MULTISPECIES: nicotinate-nucleotide--dimethylbenzimidazole phosphoribosyltransferase [unclassified Methylophaga]|jgi:nicotinate-nucleotide--dimethylbenzimidazole phosphoribosyltransferase|uniref:nicotinate-nucleotide--dimethylbenzimidazole phosphoribosyltransferase n=1 Tax=unclassified Methylophaga TaxID=2629249 RepID=UPI00259CAD2F|nr:MULTISPECIES: nicotinate-nucleotide--dimethylbenzimidazole phosphoribosyltransferase [unclassified Methylophaga]|tara:strand:- start:42585 stop:43646 length:1062 start_codon:yes stop_codon:yes gene_type:complete